MAASIEELYDAGVAHFQRGNPAAALIAFDQAIADDPDNVSGLRAELLGHRGDVLRAMGRHSEAIAAFERAIALAPYVPDFAVGLADALRLAGDHRRAKELYERALELVLPGEELIDRIDRGFNALDS